MKVKSFKYWTTQQLHEQFGIAKSPTSPLFDDWLASDEPISEPEQDPKGQLLAEMLAVQALNNNENPIYGCYVLGRNWFFVILQNKYYTISDAYVATQNDVISIFKILKKVKRYIVIGKLS